MANGQKEPCETTDSKKRQCNFVLNGNGENERKKERRNSFVGYIMGLSDYQCGRYKQEVLAERAFYSAALGSLATLFAGAGSVIAHQATAKTFSAASGAASGIDATLEQERFASLGIEVITAGIDARRKEIRERA
jgi:hypothetical protein